MKLKSKNTVFIHTYDKLFFSNRKKYDDFFSKTFFKEDLEKLSLNICKGMYNGICDYEILENIDNFLEKDVYKKINNLLQYINY